VGRRAAPRRDGSRDFARQPVPGLRRAGKAWKLSLASSFDAFSPLVSSVLCNVFYYMTRRAIHARPLRLACFAPSTAPDGAGASEPMDPAHGFFPRLHLAAFYLWQGLSDIACQDIQRIF
jgi:hypothetical protein